MKNDCIININDPRFTSDEESYTINASSIVILKENIIDKTWFFCYCSQRSDEIAITCPTLISCMPLRITTIFWPAHKLIILIKHWPSLPKNRSRFHFFLKISIFILVIELSIEYSFSAIE